MRLIFGVAGPDVSDTSWRITPPPGAKTLTLEDLIGESAPVADRPLDAAMRARAIDIFENSGPNVIANLGKSGCWRLAETLLDACAETRILLLLPSPQMAVADMLAAGVEGDQALSAWRTAVGEFLPFYQRNRSVITLIEQASASTNPEALHSFCKDQFGSAIWLTVENERALEPLNAALASRLVEEAPDVTAIHEELEAAKTDIIGLGFAGFEGGVATFGPADAVEDNNLAMLPVLEENDLLRFQLRLVQSKLEAYYKQAPINAAAAEERKAELDALTGEIRRLSHETTQMRASMSWRLTAPVRFVSGKLRMITRKLRSHSVRRQIELVNASPLFDSDWYKERYNDVAQSGQDPTTHFVLYGVREGRSPGPDFDSAAYLEANPDVAASGLNPFIHYLKYGINEKRPLAPTLRQR